MRAGGVGRPKTPHRGRAAACRRRGAFRWSDFGEYRLARDAFLQQEFGRLYARVRVESRHEEIAEQHVGDGDQRHALMMGEKGTHDFRLLGAQRRAGVA